MICFSDFILSKKPWAYCRLDEPIGHNLYLDISGNRNHLYSSMSGDTYAQVATNRQAIELKGDPSAGRH